MDGLLQGGRSIGEEFDTVLDATHGTAFGQFIQSDGFGRFESTLIDPCLYSIEVYRGHFNSMPGDEWLTWGSLCF